MKTGKRSVPLDILSIEEDDYKIYVGTHGMNQITVNITRDGQIVHDQNFTFEQFVSLLMRDAHPTRREAGRRKDIS